MNQGERIKKLRETLGLTLESFGEKVGVTRGAISNLEKGNRNLTEQMTKAICREFGVDYIWLTTGEGEMFPKPDTDPLWGMLGQVLKEEKSSFRRQLITALCQLEPDELAAIEKVIDKFLAEREKAKKEEEG